MKKLLLILVLLVLSVGTCFGADGYSIIILTQDSNPGADTILYCIDDPGGTPLNRKCTVADLAKGMSHIYLSDIGTYTHAQIDNFINTSSGLASVVTCSNGQLLGTDCGSGLTLTDGFIIQIASGTVSLPPVQTGAVGCVKATGAFTVSVNPNDNDRFILDGLSLSDGDKLSSIGELDDTICFYADSSAGWTTMFNPHLFVDGN